MRRAAAFLPGLSTCIAPSGPSVRVGLRPFAVGGMPMIGPVKGVPGGWGEGVGGGPLGWQGAHSQAPQAWLAATTILSQAMSWSGSRSAGVVLL
jgi:hypothetical protein